MKERPISPTGITRAQQTRNRNSMDIIREDNGQNGIVKALDGETEAERLNYTWSGAGRIIIDHTEVYAPYGGKGLGQKLVLAAVDFARENDIRILPLCPFARKVIEKNPDAAEVLLVSGGQ